VFSNLLPSDRSGGRVERRFVGDPVFAFQREMNRLFDDMFRGFGAPALANAGAAGLGSLLMPQMDVRETENEIRIAVEMPGVAPDEVEIQLDDDVLTIPGEKKVERRDERENAHFTERAYGTFQRILRLPFKVDPDQIQARFDNGVLTVTLPKPKGQDASRRISVQSGAQRAAETAARSGSRMGRAPARAVPLPPRAGDIGSRATEQSGGYCQVVGLMDAFDRAA
jgi:HSP20 family protein